MTLDGNRNADRKRNVNFLTSDRKRDGKFYIRLKN